MDRKEKRGAIAWMAGNSVAANFLMLVLLIGGFLYGIHIKQEVFPEFELDTVTVTVSYPGSSPEEVEQGIVLAVEEAVQGLDGVKEVTSSAREGSGVVTIEGLVGADIQKLAREVQSEVDRITTFPEEAEEPQVEIATHRRQVISLILYGNQDEKILREVGEEVRDDLLQKPDITQLELSSVRNLEISIEVPEEKLRAYNLTLEEVAEKVQKASVEVAGGGIKTDSGEVLLRMKERRDYGKEFANVPIITTNDGTVVRLEDIAVIIDGFEDSDKYATYNGKRAVLVDVYRVGEQTPIQVADTVYEYLKELRETLPPGISVAVVNDQSEVYRQRLELLLSNGYLGLVLVFVLLGLFLETRLAFWVAMGIPISFLGSLLFLPAMGASINMMTMFAFIIALGIVVDDAIVVGENVYKYRQEGYPFLKAAVRGAQDVAMPVTFSVLTNVTAFMPLYFVPGIPGKIFKCIPIVVISVFLISLVESMFVLPSHLGHQKEREHRGLSGWLYRRQQGFSRGFTRAVERFYAPFLNLVLKHRYVVLSTGLAILMLVLGYVKSGRMGMTLFPRVESDFAIATAVLPYGSSVKKTEVAKDILEKAAFEIAKENGGDRSVKCVFSEIGATSNGVSGEHIAQVRVYLTPPKQRTVQTADFVKLWRQRVGTLPGLESLTFKSDAGGPGSGSALTVELSHRSMNVLEAASAELSSALGYFPNVKDIDDGFTPGKQQIDFKIRAEGRALGLTAEGVAKKVRHAFYGAEVLRQQRGRNEIKVMVRLPKKERISEYNLEGLILRTSSKNEVPLRDVVEIKRGRAYTDIDRRAGRRVVTVTADVDPPSGAESIMTSLKKDTLPALASRYAGLSYSFEGRQAEMRDSMKSLVRGLILAMLAVYALLAIPLRSYTQPAIIMTSIPFGIVGAVLGHLLMGYSLSVMSMFGLVALSGVVVNDALVLIDFANRERQRGVLPREAVHSAALHRFRPIMLTTLTTFGGLAPMIFETSRQARFLIPMALSLGFGILFATFITLILIPALYLILEDMHSLKGDEETAFTVPNDPFIQEFAGMVDKKNADTV